MDGQEAARIVFIITFSILIGGTAFLFIREQLLSRERARILHHNPEFSDYRFCVNCRQRLPKTSGKRFFFSSFLMFEARNRAEENRIAADCNIKDAVCYLHSHRDVDVNFLLREVGLKKLLSEKNYALFRLLPELDRQKMILAFFRHAQDAAMRQRHRRKLPTSFSEADDKLFEDIQEAF